MAVIKPISAADTIDLRHRVMWPDLPREAVILDGDQTAFHLGAYVDSALVGVTSFFPEGDRVRLRKLAVDFEHQGKGVATDLIGYAVHHFRQQGMQAIWCDARVSAVGFYTRNGFIMASTVFEKQGLPYSVATLVL